MNAGAKRLGLNKFKMISQDKDSTVFQHPAGHTITVAHNSLSKDLKTQLLGLSKAGQDEKTRLQADEEKHKGKMAEGGEVEESTDDKTKAYQEEKIGIEQREQQSRDMKGSDRTGDLMSESQMMTLRKKHGMAKGGKVQQYAQGEMVEGDNQQLPQPIQASPNDIGFADPKTITSDVPEEYRTEEDKQAAANQEAAKDYTALSGSTSGLATKVGEKPESATPPPALEEQTLQTTAAPEQSKPEVQPAQTETPEEKAVNTFHTEKNDILQQSDNFNKDLMMGHIEPKTYQDLFAKKDTLGKIGTIFGMLLSGLGSGLSGQKNQLMEMMNQQIQNDLDAQKSSATNAQNFLKINNEGEVQHAQAKNMTVDAATKAYSLAKMQMNAAALHHLTQMANKLPPGSPQAQVAQQQLAMINNAVQTENYNLADRAATASAQMNLMMGIGQGGASDIDKRLSYLRVANPSMAKEIEERYVPGVGVGSVAVPQAVREDIISHEKLNNAAKDVMDFSKQHTNIIPGTPSYNTGVQKAVVLQQMVREGLLGTVFRESEKPLLKQVVDENPAGVFKLISTQPKLKALIESNIQQLNATKKAYGLPESKQQSEPQYKTVNGVKYMRGPNGEAIPVK